MAEVTHRNLANARLLVGATPAQLTRVRGMSTDGVTISPAGDEGGVMTGVQGDSMSWQAVLGAYTITVSSLPASRAIKTILQAAAAGVAYYQYVDGQYNIGGTFVLQNRGDVTMTNAPRVLTLACTTIKNSDEAVGEVVQVA